MKCFGGERSKTPVGKRIIEDYIKEHVKGVGAQFRLKVSINYWTYYMQHYLKNGHISHTACKGYVYLISQ